MDVRGTLRAQEFIYSDEAKKTCTQMKVRGGLIEVRDGLQVVNYFNRPTSTENKCFADFWFGTNPLS